MKLLFAVLAVLSSAFAGEPQPAPKPVEQTSAYRAYWLSGPEPETRSGYRTLLVTPIPIEKLSGHTRRSEFLFDNTALTFRTYQHDSLWDTPFRPVQHCSAVNPDTKTVVLDGITFSYEPGDLKDVVRLLENPLGTILLNRRQPPLLGAKQTAKAFRLLLQDQIRNEK
jgi:hypothetical protein